MAMQALLLAMARVLGCVQFIPIFGRRHMALLHRNAIALALSLPQAWALWASIDAGAQPLNLLPLVLKEALLGCAMGLLLCVPVWAFSAAFTLVDNQRGANAAQQQNPSLQADASMLGELGERMLVLSLVHSGGLMVLLSVLADSYRAWPALEPLPPWSPEARAVLLGALQQLMAHALVWAAPVLLLLLLVEFALAIASLAAQGVDVYQMSLPLKSVMALVMLAVCAAALIDDASGQTLAHWFDLMRIGLASRNPP